MQQFIVKAALVTAAVGPVLVGIGKVTSSIGTITSGIGKVMTHLGGLSGAMTAFSSVDLLPMIGIIAAVVAAVVAVIAIIKNWGAISNWFKGVWEGVYNGVFRHVIPPSRSSSDQLHQFIGNHQGLIPLAVRCRVSSKEEGA